MAVEVALNTPLADALTNVVQPKLSEAGWSSPDDSALSEYVILMLVNGKTQDQIATELSTDLLSLAPEDTGASEFARWLFEQVQILNNQLNGGAQDTQAPTAEQQGAGQGLSIKGVSSQNIEAGAPNGVNDSMEGIQDGSVPTGPKSMRSNSRPAAGGPGAKRMMGQISKAMDRTNDAALHRVRPQQGTERINMHNRQPPRGPKNDMSRNNRGSVPGRPHMPPGMSGGPPGFQQISPQQQMQLLKMYEEQARMMASIFSPGQFGMGMGQPAINPAFNGSMGQQPGRSLFDRVESNPQRPNGAFQKPSQHNFNNGSKPMQNQDGNGMNGVASDDISSSMEVEASQPEPSPDTTCRFNLKCTKQDCPYAHQSPAAPSGTPIDTTDVCSFGAACKNKKCVGRHPSPAQKLGYQIEQDCKFFPNCTNPSCSFRHPTMPACRHGADCSISGCKFTHVKINCKFNPCLNPQCPYKHAEGQKRGKYGDKVWTAERKDEDGGEHVSERKFIDDEMAEEELVVPGTSNSTDEQRPGSQHSGAEVVT